MFQLEKFFVNVFDKNVITSVRLANFGHYTLNRLMATNNGDNTTFINALSSSLDNLKAELGSTDTAVGFQKGITLTADQFLEGFRESIRRCEGAILFTFGATNTPAYLEFFPSGLTEYSQANKIHMPVLLNRLKEVATKYAAKLDAGVVQQLQGFETAWQAIRNEQVKQKATVTSNRSNRDGARKDLELVLLNIIHSIANRYPGNPDECMTYFNMSLLSGQSRRQKKEEGKSDVS